VIEDTRTYGAVLSRGREVACLLLWLRVLGPIVSLVRSKDWLGMRQLLVTVVVWYKQFKLTNSRFVVITIP
jgi:hypothetical protein